MRNKLVEALAYGWRYAENIYLDYDDSIVKDSMRDIQNACNLTEEEQEAMEDMADYKAKIYKLKYSIGDNTDSKCKNTLKIIKDTIKYEIKALKSVLRDNKKCNNFSKCILNKESIATLEWLQDVIEGIEKSNKTL